MRDFKSVLAGITRPGVGGGFGMLANPAPHAPIKIQNRVRMEVVDPDGRVKQRTPWMENILTTFGLASLASMVGSGAGVNASTWVSSMRLGTQTTAAVSTDTSLLASTAVVHITQASLTKTNLGNRTVEYQATFASDNPAGAAVINEVGLFCNSTGNTQCAARAVLGTNSVNKGASDTINVSYDTIFTTG